MHLTCSMPTSTCCKWVLGMREYSWGGFGWSAETDEFSTERCDFPNTCLFNRSQSFFSTNSQKYFDFLLRNHRNCVRQHFMRLPRPRGGRHNRRFRNESRASDEKWKNRDAREEDTVSGRECVSFVCLMATYHTKPWAPPPLGSSRL